MNTRQIAQDIIESLGLEYGPSMQESAIADIVRILNKEFNRRRLILEGALKIKDVLGDIKRSIQKRIRGKEWWGERE